MNFVNHIQSYENFWIGLGLRHERRRNRETIHRMANPDPDAVRLWGLCLWCLRGSSCVACAGHADYGDCGRFAFFANA